MRKTKKRYSVWLGVVLLHICLTKSIAQTNKNVDFHDHTIDQIVLPESNLEDIDFRPNIVINPMSFFDEYRSAFGLSNADKMHLLKTKTDDLGYTHYTLSQYYRNIKVDGGIYILHFNDAGYLYSGNGHLISGLNISATNPEISLNEARDIAMQYSGAKIFLWENEEYESRLKIKNNGRDTSYFPKGELIWAMPQNKDDGTANDYLLAYTFDIHCYSPLKSMKIVVSANDGKVIRTENYSSHCTQLNNAPNPFYSPTTVFIQWTGSTYRLYDDCQSGYIWVRDWNSTTTTPNAIEITDVSGTNWNTQVKTLGTATLWGLEKSRNYFSSVFSRNGWDNNNGDIDAYVNARFTGDNCAPWPFTSSNEDNASFSWPATGPAVCKVGSGCNQSGNIDSWGTIDILGHEFTHGVTGTAVSGGLTYQGESGALNESFSGIFGEMIENYSITGGCDYLEGADRLDTWGSPDPIRSLSNPNAFNDPDTYGGTYWAPTSSSSPDNGGVHTNSGVQNYFFYLLAEGGSGTNDNGNSYSVSGIGKTAAAAIAYRALDIYFTSSSNYSNARTHWIKAARDLYGNCSNEAYQTARAWHAVGVGSKPTTLNYNGCLILPYGIAPFIFYGQSAVASITTPYNSCGTTTVNSGGSTYLTANEITLTPGFTALSGCNFTAYVTPCTTSVARPIGIVADNITKSDRNSPAKKNKVDVVLNPKDITVSPNPFNSSFNLEISLPDDAQVTISIINLAGIEIEKLVQNEYRQKGLVQMQYKNERLAQGIYFCKIEVDGRIYTKKLVKM